LADVALDALSAHIEEFGTGQDGLLLHSKGRPLARPRFGEVWRSVREQAAMPTARFHDYADSRVMPTFERSSPESLMITAKLSA
jgi:hypothetical protein